MKVQPRPHKTVTLHVRLEPDLMARVEWLAREDGHDSVSAWVRGALQLIALERNAKRRNK